MPTLDQQKPFTVYTYFYPDEIGRWRGFPVLAYTRYNAPSESLKVYIVMARSGAEAKKKAFKMRKAEEEAMIKL